MPVKREFMKKAIEEALRGIKRKEGGPFGACIVKNGEIVACAHNEVLKNRDPTAHAEIQAIRKVCKELGKIDLSDCEIYSTTEPCPMCFSAIHWARIKKIIYGTNIKDVQRLGFNELPISNYKMRLLGKSKILIRKDFMRRECLKLLEKWKSLRLDVY